MTTTVLHLINTGGPGGAETVCTNLVRHLDRARWRSVVVVPDRGCIHAELERLGVTVIVLSDRRYRDLPRYVRQLVRIIRQERVSLVQTHLFLPGVVGSLVGALLGIPVVATMHGEGDVHPRERLRRAKFALLNRAARVVFVSEALRRHILAAGPLRAERTAVIANGVDLARYERTANRALRRSFGVRDSDVLVGAVGNIRPAKSYDVLLRAAALLRQRSSDYQFVIFGKANQNEALERELLALRAALGLDDVVRFAGFHDDVPEALGALDLFVLTSRSEGFSIAVVEAMAAGLPIVATRCGGPEDILADGSTGLLVDTGSPEAIADAIERIRMAPGLGERLGAGARQAAHHRFSMEAQVNAYESLYDACLGGRPGHRTREDVVGESVPGSGVPA